MYRTSEQMYPIIERYVNGEESKQSLCSENNLSIHVFQYWLSKYNRAPRSKAHQPNFVPIQIDKINTGQCIRIKLSNGTEIEIPMA